MICTHFSSLKEEFRTGAHIRGTDDPSPRRFKNIRIRILRHVTRDVLGKRNVPAPSGLRVSLKYDIPEGSRFRYRALSDNDVGTSGNFGTQKTGGRQAARPRGGRSGVAAFLPRADERVARSPSPAEKFRTLTAAADQLLASEILPSCPWTCGNSKQRRTSTRMTGATRS